MGIHEDIAIGCDEAAEAGTRVLAEHGIDACTDATDLFLCVSHNTCDYDLSYFISRYIEPTHPARAAVSSAMFEAWSYDEWFGDFVDSAAEAAVPFEEDTDFGPERPWTVSKEVSVWHEGKVRARSHREALALAASGADWELSNGDETVLGYEAREAENSGTEEEE